MTFWQRIRAAIARFMTGRRGADEFSLALLIFGLALSLAASFSPRLAALSLAGTAAYVYALFRILSRRLDRRASENLRFLTLWRRGSGAVRQFSVRLKNARTYKYFKCPQCHARLRLPRKVGEVTVTCGKCRHAFKQRA